MFVANGSQRAHQAPSGGMSLVHGVVTAALTAFLFVPLLPELGTNHNSLLQTWRS